MLLALRILERLFDIGFQPIEIERVKLRRSCWISPALVSTVKCLEIAARDISKGSATSVTAMSSSSSKVRICRLVGSERAEKIRSRELAMT